MRQFLFFLVSFTFISAAFAQDSPVRPVRQLSVCGDLAPFLHGVASGDPLHDRVIIWTRVTPDSTVTGPVIVSWRMAADTGMSQVVASGSQLTNASMDYTVKVDVTGLTANTWYYYEFTALNVNSVRGRTRTAPLSMQDSLRFAVVSCANLEAGYFNVYRSIYERNDVDAVVCLGDYIYEYESGGYSPNPNANRQWQPGNEIVSLTDYRTRYSSYHLDEDLMKLHQQYPWILVWDDHESANDSWMNGAENHQTNEGAWASRKAAAVQAYFEWLPVRRPNPNNQSQVFRNITFGPLVEFIVLDTRLEGRDLQAGTSGATVTDVNRQLLGTNQFNWLASRLDSSQAQWKILAQQVMVAPLEVFGVGVNGDQWDGYPAERDRVYNHILNNNIHDVVVITGDIHTSWANDLPTGTYNSSNGAGSVGVEFVAPSVTSPGFSLSVGASVIMSMNSHVKYADLSQHGYIIMDVNQSRTQSDWFYVATIDNASSQFSYGDSWYNNHLERFLRHGTGAAVPRPDVSYLQAPECPRANIMLSTPAPALTDKIIGLYPNPAREEFTIQFYLETESWVNMKIVNMSGQVVSEEKFASQPAGVFNLRAALPELAAGLYTIVLETATGVSKIKLVKE